MVQTPFYPARENWQPGPPNPRFGLPVRSASSVHGRELNIQQALRDCAGVPVKEYALFVILENGTKNFHSTSGGVQNHTNFTPVWDALDRAAAKGEKSASISSSGHEGMWSTNNDLDSETSYDDRRLSNGENRRRRHHQRQSRSEESDEFGNSRKKRSRPSTYRRGGSDDPPLSVITSTKTQQLRIGDEEEVLRFYIGRFKDMQQNACKIMGKVFVKTVEPKKQTHHPYTGGNGNAPKWWPQSGSPEFVRHKEPDHLLKNERVFLLAHILGLVVWPNENQLECIRNQKLTVKKLEETTMETMNNWFNDKEHPENMEKKKYLKEIFKIAKQQERYKAGQIDGTSFCNVMFGDRPVEDSSEDELEDTPIEEVQEHGIPPHLPGGMASSDELVSPMMQNLKTDVDSPTMFQNTRRAPLVRYASQSHINDHSTSFNDASLYPRGVGLGFQSNGQTDSQRGYGSSPVYQNPQPIYAGWNAPSQGMVSSSSPSTAFYPTSSQSAPGNLGGPFHLPALSTSATSQSMLPPLATNPFDIPPSRYDMGPAIGNQVRTGSHGHPHINHHGFSDYLTNVTSFTQPDEHQNQLHQPEQR